jgi:mannose-1-phosphate guanylyltransferase
LVAGFPIELPGRTPEDARVQKAFVLGAGLGTRLLSLTEHLPKPLVPVCQRPLIAYAFEHLRSAGVREFVVNTHHCAEAYPRFFPDGAHGGCPITFRHEPVLLETGGGIDNVSDLLRGDDFLVYNGDILTDLPLAPAIAAHRASDNLATLILRSDGAAQHIAWEAETGKVRDIRDKLGSGLPTPYQFTGIYVCRPEFLGRLHQGTKHSVILPFLEIIADGARLGAVVADEGNWWDLGTRETYLAAQLALLGSDFPRYAESAAMAEWKTRVHPTARIGDGAEVDAMTILCEGAVVEAGAKVRASVVWPRAVVRAGAELDHCIVREGVTVSGTHRSENL